MLNILHHEGNANQNYTNIPFHPSYINHQENKQQVLVRMQEKKGILIYCWWECKLVYAP
jgi:hypothetical protein